MAQVRRNAGQVDAVDGDPPGRRGLETCDDPQQRRLAAPARAEQRQRLACVDLDRRSRERRGAVEGDRDILGAQHQSAPRRAASRSAPSTAAVVTAIRTTQSAAAAPWFSAPGRPRKRKIATGSVGWSLRARKTVAPNSPSAIANASPAAIPSGRSASGRSISRRTPRRRGAERGRDLAQPRIDRPQRRSDQAHDERRGHQRLHDGDDPDRAAEVDRCGVEADHEPVAEHHRRRAEWEHHRDVQPPGGTACDHRGRQAADDERDRRGCGGVTEGVEDRVPGRDEQRRCLLPQRAVEREPDPVGVSNELRTRATSGAPSRNAPPPRLAASAIRSRRVGERAALRSETSGATRPAFASRRDETATMAPTATSWSSESAAAVRRSNAPVAAS